MCKSGKCVWRRSLQGFHCIKCEKQIFYDDYKKRPGIYRHYRYHANVVCGPFDGGEVRFPFQISKFWTDNECNVLHFEFPTEIPAYLYEYEIEPFGDFVFTRLIVGRKTDAP